MSIGLRCAVLIVRGVVLQRVGERGERHGEVPAAVRQQRELALDHEMHREFYRPERGGRYEPGQVGQARIGPAPADRDQPGDGDRGRGEQDGFPGDRAVGEQRGGQQVHPGAAPPVGEQAAQHARLGHRFRGVPAHADDQAEVGDEGEPPQGVPTGCAGEHAAEHGHGRYREEVEHDQHDGHELVLAEREDPGQDRVPDAGVPVGLVHRDAERGGVPVGRVHREPVVELAVIPLRRHQEEAAGELGPVRVDVPGHDEQAEMPLGPDLPAGQGETEPAEEGDDPRYQRMVQPGP